MRVCVHACVRVQECECECGSVCVCGIGLLICVKGTVSLYFESIVDRILLKNIIKAIY